MPPTSARHGLVIGLTLWLGLGSIARASPPSEPSPELDPTPRRPTVAIARFTGDAELAQAPRERIAEAFTNRGYESRLFAVSLPDAASQSRCVPTDARCIAKLGRWLSESAKLELEFLVTGDLSLDGEGEVVVHNLATGLPIVRIEVSISPNDLVIPLMLGEAVARRLDELRFPPAPASAAELALLAALDEPGEHWEPNTTWDPYFCYRPGVTCYPGDPPDDPPHIRELPEVDLRDHDFKNYCRVERRDGPPELPVCRLGPTFGYFRPRTWTSMSLTGASAIATAVLYSLAYAPTNLPDATSERLEVGGHVMLGTTLALGTVLTLVILRDRQQAKRYILGEKLRIELLP